MDLVMFQYECFDQGLDILNVGEKSRKKSKS